METKKEFFELIQSNIDEHGYHVTIVTGGPFPRYAYTIGLMNRFGFELVFAGGAVYMKKDLYKIFNFIVSELSIEINKLNLKVSVGSLGDFTISRVDASWSKLMLLGVYDFFNLEDIEVRQIKPDSEHSTLDIPNMKNIFDASFYPMWQWLNHEWGYHVPEKSDVVTNLNALKGAPITEIIRCEESEWEMFAGSGPDVEKEDARVVPLGVILGIDETLHAALKLDIGQGLWRDGKEDSWHDWR